MMPDVGITTSHIHYAIIIMEPFGKYFALAIGFCIVSGAYGAGAISGGAFNPAVAVVLDLTSASVLGFPWGPW